jgi:hypothetical protein
MARHSCLTRDGLAIRPAVVSQQIANEMWSLRQANSQGLIEVNTRALTVGSHVTSEDGCMKATRFLPPRKEAADQTKASHEVMELVRQSPKFSLLVIQLREAGRSWSDVKARIEAQTKPPAQGRSQSRVKRSD